jgi:hypothetical protein
MLHGPLNFKYEVLPFIIWAIWIQCRWCLTVTVMWKTHLVRHPAK